MKKAWIIFCKIGWHMSIKRIGWDGVSFTATCNHCGYKGLVDSHGDLF